VAATSIEEYIDSIIEIGREKRPSANHRRAGRDFVAADDAHIHLTASRAYHQRAESCVSLQGAQQFWPAMPIIQFGLFSSRNKVPRSATLEQTLLIHSACAPGE